MEIKREKIISKVIEILKENPQGIRYSEIIKRVKDVFPDLKENTIHGTIWDLHIQKPEEVYKPERGLYRHVSFKGKEEIIKTPEQTEKKIREEDFYQPFADFLMRQLEDCTYAIPLGGNKFKGKWGTPDVIGTYTSNQVDILKHETEVVSAEIKIDDSSLITAFGQACAYKAFSHKVYIVIPESASEEDIDRIESLSLICGIGLILFDATNKEEPDFKIRARPIKHEPDNFYVNTYMNLLRTEKELFR